MLSRHSKALTELINNRCFPHRNYANKFLLIFTNITNRIQCRVEFKIKTCIEMSMTVFE